MKDLMLTLDASFIPASKLGLLGEDLLLYATRVATCGGMNRSKHLSDTNVSLTDTGSSCGTLTAVSSGSRHLYWEKLQA